MKSSTFFSYVVTITQQNIDTIKPETIGQIVNYMSSYYENSELVLVIQNRHDDDIEGKIKAMNLSGQNVTIKIIYITKPSKINAMIEEGLSQSIGDIVLYEPLLAIPTIDSLNVITNELSKNNILWVNHQTNDKLYEKTNRIRKINDIMQSSYHLQTAVTDDFAITRSAINIVQSSAKHSQDIRTIMLLNVPKQTTKSLTFLESGGFNDYSFDHESLNRFILTSTNSYLDHVWIKSFVAYMISFVVMLLLPIPSYEFQTELILEIIVPLVVLFSTYFGFVINANYLMNSEILASTQNKSLVGVTSTIIITLNK